MGQIIHKRFVSGTSVFHEELKNLGFEECGSEGHGLNKVYKFKKEDKIVHSSYEELVLIKELEIGSKKEDHKGFSLQEIKDKKRVDYRGLTVHDEMLKFFATRNPIKVNPNE